MSFSAFGRLNSAHSSRQPAWSKCSLCQSSLRAPRLLWRHPRRDFLQQKARGIRRCPLQVQAGLNYPHMPNRMRRQIQEVKYTVQLYLVKLASFLVSLPGLKQVVHSCKSLRARLDPFLVRLSEYREHLSKVYLKRMDMYDEFCLDELKRKYRWKAYARRDEEAMTSFLKLAFYRVGVIVCIAEWEFLAPCGFLWTCILPLIIGRAQIPQEDPMWWWYLAIMILFIFLKHPWGLPLRWV